MNKIIWTKTCIGINRKVRTKISSRLSASRATCWKFVGLFDFPGCGVAGGYGHPNEKPGEIYTAHTSLGMDLWCEVARPSAIRLGISIGKIWLRMRGYNLTGTLFADINCHWKWKVEQRIWTDKLHRVGELQPRTMGWYADDGEVRLRHRTCK